MTWQNFYKKTAVIVIAGKNDSISVFFAITSSALSLLDKVYIV